MPWIESHTLVSRHRKTLDCARALRIQAAHLVGHLHCLWHSALEQQEDGDLAKWSDEAIAEAALYKAAASTFVRLLTQHGWLNADRTLHDWLDYAGKFLIRKYSTSNRERLVEIWAKHGRVYGFVLMKDSEQKATKERTESDRKVTSTLPNLTLPNLSEFHSLGAFDLGSEDGLMAACAHVLGPKCMKQWGGKWRKRVREKAGKVKRVLLCVKEEMKTKVIHNPGGYADDLFEKRFAD